MHIAIDARPLEGGHSGRGTGKYTRLLVDALAEFAPSNTYSLFTKPEDFPRTVDVVHYPFFDPFFLTLPMKRPAPTVVTVHDLIPLVYPMHFRPGLRGAFKWRAQRWSLNHVQAVITDSEASKRDIVRFTTLPAARVTVVPLAPDEKFGGTVTAAMRESVKKKYGLPARFLLYVGDVNWNKNVPGMLRAVAKVADVPLVLVGRAFEHTHIPEVRVIDKLTHELNLTSRIIKTGYVDDEALMVLYALAKVSITPSFAEGFGFPVLEAMASGTPTVVATGSSLDEIAGPSVRVNPKDPADMAAGIEKAMKMERASWQKKARAWVKKFSWKQVARATTHVYETVAA